MYIIKSSTDSSPSTSSTTEVPSFNDPTDTEGRFPRPVAWALALALRENIFAYLYVPLLFILAIVGGLVVYCWYPIKGGRRGTYVAISADAGAAGAAGHLGDLGVTTGGGGGGGMEPFGYGTVAAAAAAAAKGAVKKTGAEGVDGVYVHAASPSSGSNSDRSEETLV
ncbi:hypothetical protein LZ554_004071 [Drepanopeziza brunnea f. sp. 'monogermtubi']|nr:hypothetical protein LZ554_004071 [Drepanopeziza brunnea f. sp. 'monogermtubi']